MGMRADHRGNPTVECMGEGHFFRGRLGMNVHNHGLHIHAQLVAEQNLFDGAKRVIERVHE